MFRIPGRSALGPSALPAGTPPSAPSAVTSITKDSGATVSFLPPASPGTGAITSYTVTPYISGTAQSPTTVSAGSAGSISGSNGSTYLQIPVAGLTNSTAYTFSVHASSLYGAGAESAQSGANTPLAGLLFGDDFNGPASGAIDPEWWIYDNRCGYLQQNEVEAYAAANCVLDGSGNLKLTAQHVSKTVPRYPSDPLYPGNITQPWTSGACQSNTRTYAPSSGNTLTVEARQQICADAGNGFWPGLTWLEGSHFLTQWKTDPAQPAWNTTDEAEIDIAEWPLNATVANYGNNVFANTSYQNNVNSGVDHSAAMHVFQAQWKWGGAGVAPFVKFLADGTQTGLTTTSGVVPVSGCQLFLLIYLQMVAGGPTTTESCLVDYVRVFDQNLG